MLEETFFNYHQACFPRPEGFARSQHTSYAEDVVACHSEPDSLTLSLRIRFLASIRLLKDIPSRKTSRGGGHFFINSYLRTTMRVE